MGDEWAFVGVFNHFPFGIDKKRIETQIVVDGAECLPVETNGGFLPSGVIQQVKAEQTQFIAKFDVQRILGFSARDADKIIKSIGQSRGV